MWPPEKNVACQVGGCTLGKSNFEGQSLNGAICRLQLGCAGAPSCSLWGRKALPEGLRTHNSHFPPCRHVQEGTGSVSSGLPAAFPHQNPGLAPPLLLLPLSCQLKSCLSLDRLYCP